MTLLETSTRRRPVFGRAGRAGRRRGETLGLGEVVEAFGDKAFGPVMSVFTIVSMLPWPPGGTTRARDRAAVLNDRRAVAD